MDGQLLTQIEKKKNYLAINWPQTKELYLFKKV